jgi:glucan phosphoethanolaminetransferase (alkaline phosphatase superfamily)
MFLFDVALSDTSTSVVGVGLAVVFFLIFAAIAAVAFFMIRRTVKMAIRMVIAALIFLIAVIGSIALWYGIGSSPAPRPRPNRPPANSTR